MSRPRTSIRRLPGAGLPLVDRKAKGLPNPWTLLTLLFVLLMNVAASAQTLTIAETIGKKKKSFFVAATALVAEDFTTLAFPYSQVVYGVSERLDLYGGVGTTTALGRTQASLIFGCNLNLLQHSRFSVSTFNQIITGLNDRSDSSPAIWFNSTVVSRPLDFIPGGLMGYSGYNLTIPVGDSEGKLFTPEEVLHNVPIGVMIPFRGKALFVEYGWGNKLQVVGIGIAIGP